MKLPQFDHAQKRWDVYKRFYTRPTILDAFVLFETGEAIITTDSFKPAQRRMIPGTDLRIVGTTDDDCPKLWLDPKAPDRASTEAALKGGGHNPSRVYGKPLPGAWLSPRGMQVLLVDTTTHRVVALDPSALRRHAAWDHVPAQFSHGRGSSYYTHGATAYIPGPGRVAVAASIQITIPVVLPRDTKAAMHDLWRGCVAWAELSGWNYQLAPKWWSQDTRTYYRYIYHRPFSLPETVPAMEDLSAEQRFQIARFGYEKKYFDVQVEHLYTPETN